MMRAVKLPWSGHVRRDLESLAIALDGEALRIWGPTVGATGRLTFAVRASGDKEAGEVAVLEDHDELPADFWPVQGVELSGFWPCARRMDVIREVLRNAPILPSYPVIPVRWL
jgi:hypothetical protein